MDLQEDDGSNQCMIKCNISKSDFYKQIINVAFRGAVVRALASQDGGPGFVSRYQENFLLVAWMQNINPQNIRKPELLYYRLKFSLLSVITFQIVLADSSPLNLLKLPVLVGRYQGKLLDRHRRVCTRKGLGVHHILFSTLEGPSSQ